MSKNRNKVKRTLIKEIRRIFLLICLSIVILFTGTLMIKPLQVQAVSFDDINQSSVFLKQEKGSRTCTLVSATMMVRRAAMMSGNTNWSSITENAMRKTAWLEGVGLYHSFTYEGIKVGYDTFDGSEAMLKILLKDHPEGIVLYGKTSKGGPHAILVTDYTDGVFYCADPVQEVEEGRIPISKATITIESAGKYWYVSSPKVSYENEGVQSSVLGDLNKDGQVQLADAQMILQVALGISDLDEKQIGLADVDSNGEINLDDAKKVLNVALGIEKM